MSDHNSYKPRLEPCLSDREGYKDWRRYEEIGLPVEWIDRCKKHPGTWISPEEYFWTPDDFFQLMEGMSSDLLTSIRECTGGCFYKLPLKEQCHLIGAAYSTTTVASISGDEACSAQGGKRGGKAIESVALEFFENQGWKGDRGEGVSFHIISYAVAEIVASKGIVYFPSNYKPDGSLIGRKSLNDDERTALNYALEQLNESYFRRCYARWRNDPIFAVVARTATPAYSVDHVIGCYQSLGSQALYNFCERNMLGFSGMGWPDLTLYRNNDLKTVEVKSTKDKLTHRQAYWFRNFAIPLGWTVEVLHVNTKK